MIRNRKKIIRGRIVVSQAVLVRVCIDEQGYTRGNTKLHAIGQE